MKVQDMLADKGSTVVTIHPGATVAELVALLARHNIGAVVVSTDDSGVDGIVSERDVVRALGRSSGAVNERVDAIMTATVRTCGHGDELTGLMQQMTDHRIRHLPVVEDGRLSGIVSIGDVVKARIAELEFEHQQMANYIAGG